MMADSSATQKELPETATRPVWDADGMGRKKRPPEAPIR